MEGKKVDRYRKRAEMSGIRNLEIRIEEMSGQGDSHNPSSRWRIMWWVQSTDIMRTTTRGSYHYCHRKYPLPVRIKGRTRRPSYGSYQDDYL